MDMPRRVSTLITASLVGPVLVTSACTTPAGSFARPVDRAPAGTSLIGAGALVPVHYVIDGDIVDRFDLEAATTVDDVVAVPFFSFDQALSDSVYLGLSAAYIGVNGENFGAVLTPRMEIAMDEAQRLALTLELPLGVLETDNADIDTQLQPYAAPRVGLRWAVPTGFGGFVFTQQASIAFVSFGFPGSVAYDVPIPLGERARLHLFPEFRWDPFVLISDFEGASGFLMPLSVGASVMLQL